jgi:N utilization substance protein A
VVNGTVRRFERGDIIVDLGRTEAVVPRGEQARHERYSQGDRIRAVIVNVHKEPKGPQVVLSRTDPRLLMKLFEMEVPEIYDGTVIIKNAVRAPGERAKVAVYSRERDVDPVGACVGMKGSRVQAIIRELRGEKIDIIEHSDDLVTFAQSALAPAKITRVSVKHEAEGIPHLDVIVEDAQLSLAIGKRGQNVRLAAELIGCKIDIKSESAVKDEVADALAALLHVGEDSQPTEEPIDLAGAPGIDAELAARLQAAGYAALDAIADATLDELTAVDGMTDESAIALKDWAQSQRPQSEESVDFGELAARAEKGSRTMGDADFMAALSRAFQDLDVTQEEGAQGESGEAPPKDDN